MIYKYPFRILYYTKPSIQKKRPNFVSTNQPNTEKRPYFCQTKLYPIQLIKPKWNGSVKSDISGIILHITNH